MCIGSPPGRGWMFTVAAPAGSETRPLVFGPYRPPPALGLGPPLLGAQPGLLRRPGRAGLLAMLRYPERLGQQEPEALRRFLTVLELTALRAGDDAQRAFLVDPALQLLEDARALRLAEHGRGRHVPEQLDAG